MRSTHEARKHIVDLTAMKPIVYTLYMAASPTSESVHYFLKAVKSVSI